MFNLWDSTSDVNLNSLRHVKSWTWNGLCVQVLLFCDCATAWQECDKHIHASFIQLMNTYFKDTLFKCQKISCPFGRLWSGVKYYIKPSNRCLSILQIVRFWIGSNIVFLGHIFCNVKYRSIRLHYRAVSIEYFSNWVFYRKFHRLIE